MRVGIYRFSLQEDRLFRTKFLRIVNFAENICTTNESWKQHFKFNVIVIADVAWFVCQVRCYTVSYTSYGHFRKPNLTEFLRKNLSHRLLFFSLWYSFTTHLQLSSRKLAMSKSKYELTSQCAMSFVKSLSNLRLAKWKKWITRAKKNFF